MSRKERGRIGHLSADGSNRCSKCDRVLGAPKSIIAYRIAKVLGKAQPPRRFVIRTRRLCAICGKTGRPEYLSIRTAQFFRRRHCQTNLLQALPAGASRVASIRRRVTHWVEGGSQPKGPGLTPSRRHVLITVGGKRPLKYGVPGVIEISSTETSAPSQRVI